MAWSFASSPSSRSTAAIICFQHQIFGRDIVIDGQSTAKRYVFSGYADAANGGKSTFTPSSEPLAWSCDLKPGSETLSIAATRRCSTANVGYAGPRPAQSRSHQA